jgi:hypothetical protein
MVERRCAVIDNAAARDSTGDAAIPSQRFLADGSSHSSDELPRWSVDAPPRWSEEYRSDDNWSDDRALMTWADRVDPGTAGAGTHWADDVTVVLPALPPVDFSAAGTALGNHVVPGTAAPARIDAAARAAMEAVTEALTATTAQAAISAADHAIAARAAKQAATSGSAGHVLGTAAAVALPQTPAAAGTTTDHELGDRLPSSERNMLIFVSMLLAVGAIAVIATMGIGRFG